MYTSGSSIPDTIPCTCVFLCTLILRFLKQYSYTSYKYCNSHHFVMTMETASLSTLSPNTSMLSVGLTSRAWNMARVATGSTADIRAPNEKLEGQRKWRTYRISWSGADKLIQADNLSLNCKTRWILCSLLCHMISLGPSDTHTNMKSLYNMTWRHAHYTSRHIFGGGRVHSEGLTDLCTRLRGKMTPKFDSP